MRCAHENGFPLSLEDFLHNEVVCTLELNMDLQLEFLNISDNFFSHPRLTWIYRR